MRLDEVGADEYVLTPEQEDRSVALAVARDLLLVKAGKFAERPLNPDHLIALAMWILGVPDPDEVMELAVQITREQSAAIRQAIQRDVREGRA